MVPKNALLLFALVGLACCQNVSDLRVDDVANKRFVLI